MASLSSPTTPSSSMPAAAPLAEGSRAMLVFCLFALYVIWGSTYLAVHWALQGGLPPFLMASVRFLTAGLILYTALRLRGAANPTARQWAGGAVLGVLLLLLGNGAVVFSQQSVSSGVVALVVGSVPLWAALFSGLQGQWPGRAERWGLAIGFCGLIVLNMGSELRGNTWATLALCVGPMSWALGSVISRRLPLAGGLMASATQMLTGGVFFLLVSLLRGEHLTAVPSAKALLSLGYLIIFGSLVAFSAYGYLLRHTRPALAMSYAYVNPMVAVLLGVALAGESLSLGGLVAMGAILGSVVLITRARA
ncbi:Permease of the drug/metabolite transporter (DMT) superfamily [Cystobacter fuscus DSM 2262]|uniref:Permease of the drug/metabolite transporter (DMT) superfamily n=1 Tax=Cystobacter fuscus (strain ATCC 25194 / DSM 2262 / NBRC 100088 / M29) TaxID=1242864 RepID=S9PA34_CYSF2|nr:drug/metabolite exporter YedA [Cystobacter fuscus]EPX61265.1 Permease of the drug/metabolite transporter (DMT) superfamily [Cystobacter fuscus DSM 2262]